MLEVVLKDWVTETKETDFSSNSSTSLAKSARERVRELCGKVGDGVKKAA